MTDLPDSTGTPPENADDGLPYALGDLERDLIGKLHIAMQTAVKDAVDPGAVIGGILPLLLIELFNLPDDQRKPFFDCAAGMLLLQVKTYGRPDVLQSTGDIALWIATTCERFLTTVTN